jgi:hypothetical protein
LGRAGKFRHLQEKKGGSKVVKNMRNTILTNKKTANTSIRPLVALFTGRRAGGAITRWTRTITHSDVDVTDLASVRVQNNSQILA